MPLHTATCPHQIYLSNSVPGPQKMQKEAELSA